MLGFVIYFSEMNLLYVLIKKKNVSKISASRLS